MEEEIVKTTSKKNKIIAILIVLLALIISVVLYTKYVGTTGLEVIENPIINDKLPTSFNGFKVVTISDICYGKTTTLKDIKRLVRKTNELKPDIIIFLGDLFDKEIKIREKDVDELKDELNKLDALIGKYAVKGDNDYSNITDYETILKYADFNILDNANDMIYYKGNIPIRIVGTTSLLKSKINYEEAFAKDTEEEYFTMVISHEPKTIEKITDTADVAFAGHSLGGLLNIPFVGGVIKFKGSDDYIKGEYKIKNTTLYVNSGIGTHKYGARWFNRPSINLYRLYNK